MPPAAKLNIVHVTGMASEKYGGFERWIVALAQACARRGHHLWTVWEGPPANPHFSEDLATAGAESVILPVGGRGIRFGARFTRWLWERDVDVLHAHFTSASTYSLAAARLLGVPARMLTLHSALDPRQVKARRAPFKFKWYTLLRHAMTTHILAVSQTVLDQYRSVGLVGVEAGVHYLGIELAKPARDREEVRRSFGLVADHLVVACVAHHEHVKGVDVLVRAMKRLGAAFPNTRLLQVGRETAPGQTSGLLKLAEELAVTNRIVWAGVRNDVPEILQCADVYCQPSRQEGLGLTILEAMDAGLPVVATRAGGISEAVLDAQTGLLTEPESPDALATALGALLADPGRRKQMGELGRRRVREQFDLSRQVASLVDMYEEMCS
jgi:glycosyltransferase involved in cell wall biosynthesis